MASRKALLIAAASMAVVVGALLPVTAWPVNHVVGNDGWRLGVNYDTWAGDYDGIPVGQTLEFIYDPALYNVVLVDEGSYNRCIVPSNVQPLISGHDILQLEVAGKYFFICGIGDHCTRGMKVAITAI